MSEIKVNKLSSRTGNAVTLGTSGDTFTIPAGVTLTNSGTATGFGSDSDISWQAVVSADTTMVAGRGYFVDSSGSAITMTLPASPSAGDTVSVVQIGSNTVTIARNGSNINSTAANKTLLDGASTTLVYTSSATIGWQQVNNDIPETYVEATGGTVTTSGNFKIHTFNSSSNFVVSKVSGLSSKDEVSYMVVGGGAGGGAQIAGGGGAGGFREGRAGNDTYSVSPKNAPAGIEVTAQTYPITVGAGGAGAPTGTIGCASNNFGTDGGNSIFSTITSAGGGGGAGNTNGNGKNGGSAGGGGLRTGTGGSGNTPPVSPPQGNNGGNAVNTNGGAGGGGGGAGGNGSNASGCSPAQAGPGGNGVANSITGSSVTRAGGGGGGGRNNSGDSEADLGAGGSGGGGAGTKVGNCGAVAGGAGTANTGGGGGGSGYYPGPGGAGGAGGSGVVIIRYKYQ